MSYNKMESRRAFMKKLGKLAGAAVVAVASIIAFAHETQAHQSTIQMPQAQAKRSALEGKKTFQPKEVSLGKYVHETTGRSFAQVSSADIQMWKFRIESLERAIALSEKMAQDAIDRGNMVMAIQWKERANQERRLLAACQQRLEELLNRGSYGRYPYPY